MHQFFDGNLLASLIRRLSRGDTSQDDMDNDSQPLHVGRQDPLLFPQTLNFLCNESCLEALMNSTLKWIDFHDKKVLASRRMT